MEKTAEQETAKTFQRTRMVVMAAAFAALACVATMVVKVPSPTGGYMNLGDTVVLLGGYLLGPAWGALAGSIGPALADVLLGSPIYAPATLVIKAGMAALAAACHQAFGKGRGPLALRPAASWESCPWWWATGCTTPCCWGARLVLRRVSPAIWCRLPSASPPPHCWRRLWAAAPTSGGSSPGCDPSNMEESSPGGPLARRGSFASEGESERCLWRGPLARRRTPEGGRMAQSPRPGPQARSPEREGPQRVLKPAGGL
ncbi:MAG: ECF transporter S component [Dysosmobacter sp.]